MEQIPFNKPYMTGKELFYISRAHQAGKLAGDGPYTKKCHTWLEQNLSCQKALLTHSCTAALEMAALLLDIQDGDEVIVPSYTFVSTANAFVLRGAVPVFVDIRPDTLNIDEKLIEAAITPKTKAIVVVHYAGIACEMDVIMDIAKRHNVAVVEDAAQAIMSSYRGRSLGSIGDLGTLSFHETKNIISGEGGALLINSDKFLQRAEILREKGTDRSRFFRGEVDKYTWQDLGSSFLPGELIAAFLWAQLEEAEKILNMRLSAWEIYNTLLEPLEKAGLLQRQKTLSHCDQNAHMYYIILPKYVNRDVLLGKLKANGMHCVFHYVPLHSSPAGQKFGRCHGSLSITEDLSARLVRLSFYTSMGVEKQEKVVQALQSFLQ